MKPDAHAESSQSDEAREELNAFVYAVSHDLRTPIRSIRGFGQILKEDQYDRLDEEGKDALDRMLAATAKLSDMLEALLAYARITQRTVAIENVNVTDLAGEVASRLSASGLCQDGRIEIEPGLAALADRDLLGQALTEFLSNACKFSDDAESPILVGGKGSAFFLQNRSLSLTSSDSARIFGPFERAHGPEIPGVGMGLAIVRRMFDLMGGKVWADVEPGNVITVWFELPAGSGNETVR